MMQNAVSTVFFAAFILGEAVHFISLPSLSFRCVEMVWVWEGAVPRWTGGRRLDASRFSLCCQRALR